MPAADRRILVTGANGFVGPHLLALLGTTAPRAVIHAWRRPMPPPPGPAATAVPSASPAVAADVTWADVELLDRAAVRQALAEARPTEVYHLAGVAHVGGSWGDTASTLEINVIGTHVLLDELRRSTARTRVLLAGSATVYAPCDEALDEDSPLAPASPYALSKLAQELLGARAFRDDDQPVLLARAFNHIGPGQDPSFFAPGFARQLAAIEAGEAPGVLHVGNLDARRDLTDVRDTVRAYHDLMARGRPGRPYNVCAGRAWHIREVLDAMVARCHVRVDIEIDPARLRPNDTPVVLGSFDRLHRETGWSPLITLDQTLADVLDDARRRREGAA